MTSAPLMGRLWVSRQMSSQFHHKPLGMCFGVSEIFDIDIVHVASITHLHILSSTMTYHIFFLYMRHLVLTAEPTLLLLTNLTCGCKSCWFFFFFILKSKHMQLLVNKHDPICMIALIILQKSAPCRKEKSK